MKVIRVVVDELPKNCFSCDFSYDRVCSVLFKRLEETRFETRPDWCPLVTMGQIDFDSLRATWEKEYYEKLKRGDL